MAITFDENFADFEEPSLRNKRTNRDRRAPVAHRTKFVPAKRAVVKGLARRNKKPSRIAGSTVSERLETSVAILKPEANPDLWYDLELEEEANWWRLRHLRQLRTRTCSGSDNDEEDNISFMADFLDRMWEEQLGRHLDDSYDGFLDNRMPVYRPSGRYAYDDYDSSSDSDCPRNQTFWDSDSSVELREIDDDSSEEW